MPVFDYESAGFAQTCTARECFWEERPPGTRGQICRITMRRRGGREANNQSNQNSQVD